jgi:cytochrome c553
MMLNRRTRKSAARARAQAKARRERLSVNPYCQVRVPGCLGRAVHIHHRKLQSQGGGDEAENLIGTCAFCHEFLHRNRNWAREHRFIIDGKATQPETSNA